jgi:hypothetical protein
MSRLIDTELGQFRCVTDGASKLFLLECPDCGEMLPMEEEILAGRKPIDHESRTMAAKCCTFQGVREFGKALICKMQSLIVMGYRPYHDEGQDQWQPSRGGGADGPL